MIPINGKPKINYILENIQKWKINKIIILLNKNDITTKEYIDFLDFENVEIITENIQTNSLWETILYAQNGYKKEFDGRWNKLAIHQEESEIVKKIFEMYVLEDKTMWEISEYLSTIKAPIRESKTKKHIWRFSINHVANILKQEAYLWNLFCNRTEVQKENGKMLLRKKIFLNG